MTPRRGIYFACDNKPRMLFQLQKCVHSIRANNCQLPIHVILVGEVPQATAEFLRGHSASLVCRQWHDYPRYVRWQPTFLKWVALQEEFDYEELLFLDADTFAFCDPTQLFEAVGPEDLHARCSFQALETDVLETRGPLLIRPPGCLPSYLRRYQALRTHLRIEPVFGLNTGIMLFKNNSHKRLEKQQLLFRKIRRMFYNGLLPYPMPLRLNLMDEVVVRLAIGFLGGFSCKEIPAALCPYYVDSYHSLGKPPAILVHTFRGYYAHFLFTQFGKEVCQEYLDVSDPSSKLDQLRLAIQWVWILLFHSSGLTALGKSWKCALARRMLHNALQSQR